MILFDLEAMHWAFIYCVIYSMANAKWKGNPIEFLGLDKIRNRTGSKLNVYIEEQCAENKKKTFLIGICINSWWLMYESITQFFLAKVNSEKKNSRSQILSK